MNKDFKHFLALLTLLSLGLALFLFFNYHRQVQIGIVIVLGAAYVLWGIIHHSLKRELNLRIILEYLAVAFLVCIGVIFLLLRA